MLLKPSGRRGRQALQVQATDQETGEKQVQENFSVAPSWPPCRPSAGQEGGGRKFSGTVRFAVFRGSLKIDLVPIVWHTAPAKVRKPRNRVRLKRLFFGVFFDKISFPGQTVHFHL